METVKHFKAWISGAAAVLTALWGWFGWLLVGWIGLLLLDYLTGSAVALKNGEWRSQTAREGIWHKLGSIVAVIVAGILDILVGQVLTNLSGVTLPFTYTVLLCPLVVVWYILTEAGSIVENAGRLGAPVPARLKKAVAALREQVDAMGEENREKG